ncbi:MAG: 3-hydroxybutyryl-CoA dehydrogenase [Cycloclasticus sp.]|nr:3-hydroxybutyryl-CoA dehydrogenase [Cycloclasticus sp. 46_83_sub15_T18]OUR81899.1 3-hydroxybutyryl-CoA dehydrogenase [Cycloclasticus sp. 46_120_T64]
MSDVKLIGVIGAGQMGRGIAQVAAMSGFEVVLFDVNKDGLDFGFNFIQKQLDKGVSKDKWEQTFVDATMSSISTSTSMDALKECDLVVEAATENKKIKFEIFKQLDNIVKEGAILASNTSSISITEIAEVTNRPEAVVGMHFMNPVPVMKLVETITGLETSTATIERTEAVAEKMGKTVVRADDVPGFAVNRILVPMINEAFYALYEGVSDARGIDNAMKLGCNQPMGPLELADFIGLDTCLAIMNVLYEGLGDTKYRPCPLLKKYVAAGRYGVKVKKGVYEY